MKISICIPTYQRIKKVKRCIESILKQSYQDFNVFVMVDNGDFDSYSELLDYARDKSQVQVSCHNEHLYGPGCWQRFLSSHNGALDDIFLGIVDDAELHPTCLEEMVKTFKENFTGSNGAVGLSQMCPGRDDYTWKEFGQMGIGKELIETFPDNQIVCPEYTFLYQDEELYNYLVSIGKFKLSKKAILNHYHPAFKPNEMDDTHRVSRGQIAVKDRKMYERRQAEGLVWGHSFNLIGGN